VDEFDKEVCNIRHEYIEERFKEGKVMMEKIERKLNGLLYIAATTLISIIAALATVVAQKW
jgi:hypothetical protein